MGCFLGTMVCLSSNLSLHVLSASSEVQGGDQASFDKGVDQANTGDGYVGPTGKQQPASKARTRPTLRGGPLLRRFCLQLRLCLCRHSFALMSCSLTRLLVLPQPRCPLLVVRPSLPLDMGRAQRCCLLVVRPCQARDVGRALRRCLPVFDSDFGKWVWPGFVFSTLG